MPGAVLGLATQLFVELQSDPGKPILIYAALGAGGLPALSRCWEPDLGPEEDSRASCVIFPLPFRAVACTLCLSPQSGAKLEDRVSGRISPQQERFWASVHA